jgi:hypothetical protein
MTKSELALKIAKKISSKSNKKSKTYKDLMRFPIAALREMAAEYLTKKSRSGAKSSAKSGSSKSGRSKGKIPERTKKLVAKIKAEIKSGKRRVIGDFYAPTDIPLSSARDRYNKFIQIYSSGGGEGSAIFESLSRSPRQRTSRQRGLAQRYRSESESYAPVRPQVYAAREAERRAEEQRLRRVQAQAQERARRQGAAQAESESPSFLSRFMD